MKPDQLSRCDRAQLAALRTLTFEAMKKAMGDVMTDDEMKAVLVRRDLIVKHFEDRVARLGEADRAVYDVGMPPSGSRRSR